MKEYRTEGNGVLDTLRRVYRAIYQFSERWGSIDSFLRGGYFCGRCVPQKFYMPPKALYPTEKCL